MPKLGVSNVGKRGGGEDGDSDAEKELVMPPIHVKFPVEESDEMEDGPLEGDNDRVIGTAIMLAILGLRNMVKPAVLLEQTSRATKMFPPGKIKGLTFSDHYNFFKVMLSFPAKGWYARARMWNLIYLQRKDGGFKADKDFAVAMFARDSSSPDWDSPNPKEFDEWAIERSVPQELTELEVEGGTGEVDTMDLWCTLLALGYFQGEQRDFVMQEATRILAEDDSGEIGLHSYTDTREETVVSRSHTYVAHMVHECEGGGHDGLRELMPLLRERAYKTATLWRTQQRDLLKKIMKKTNTNRTVRDSVRDKLGSILKFFKTIARSAMHTHPVVRCAFAPVSSPFGRADRVLTLFSLWLGSLTVNVWLQAERGVNCCVEAAAFVGCGLEEGGIPTRATPCEGFKNYDYCRNLMDDPVIKSGGDFTCEAFPRPGDWFHVFIVVLITFSVLLPVDKGLCYFVTLANTADVPDRWREQTYFQKLRRRFRKLYDKSLVTYLSVAFLDDYAPDREGEDGGKGEAADIGSGNFGSFTVDGPEGRRNSGASLFASRTFRGGVPEESFTTPRAGATPRAGGTFRAGPAGVMRTSAADRRKQERARRASLGRRISAAGGGAPLPADLDRSLSLSKASTDGSSKLMAGNAFKAKKPALRPRPPPAAKPEAVGESVGGSNRGRRASWADATTVGDATAGGGRRSSGGNETSSTISRWLMPYKDADSPGSSMRGPASLPQPAVLPLSRLSSCGSMDKQTIAELLTFPWDSPPPLPVGTPTVAELEMRRAAGPPHRAPTEADACHGPRHIPSPPRGEPLLAPPPAPPFLGGAMRTVAGAFGGGGKKAFGGLGRRSSGSVLPVDPTPDITKDTAVALLGRLGTGGGEWAPPRRSSRGRARFRVAGRAVQATVKLTALGWLRKVAREGLLRVANGLTDAFLDTERRRVRKAFLISWSSKAAFMASWATFSYFILVYGLKMYDSLGPGRERDFIMMWINYMIMDNLLLAWHSSLKNATFKTILSFAMDKFADAIDPFIWFERFDDEVMADTLDDDLADEMDDVDDLEAEDIFTNPFAS